MPAYGFSADTPCAGGAADIGWTPLYAPTWQWTEKLAPVRDWAEEFARDTIWALTGRQFGLCQITTRPCWARQLPAYLTFPSIYNPGSQGGQWAWGLVASGGGVELLFGGCGCLTGGCGCNPPSIPLPPPVYPDPATVSVVIEGVTLDPSAYRIDGWNLIRQDGKAWPPAQNLAVAAGGVNTWTVTYLRGSPVPPAAQRAQGLYAIEVAKGAVQDTSCRLSQRIQSVTRQGVSASFVSTADYLAKGLTGLYDVDQLIKQLNPGALPNRPRVVSLDMPRYSN